MGHIESWYQESKDRANFLFVYIREAHPVDGNLTRDNVREGILIEQPRTEEDRRAVATLCTTALKVSLPTVIDKIDDRVAREWAAFPDRIYVVGADGTVAYKGRPGPAGFDVAEARVGLEAALRGETIAYEPAPARRGRGGPSARFDRLDADGDGSLTLEEIRRRPPG